MKKVKSSVLIALVLVFIFLIFVSAKAVKAESKCPEGCECLPREIASEINLSSCKGQEITCNETENELLFCFELNMSQFIEENNQKIKRLPGVIRKLLGNEKFNIIIDNWSFSITTKDGLIREISKPLESPDIKIQLSKEVIKRIASSEDSVAEILKILREGKITYSGVTLKGKIKIFLMKFSLHITGLFIKEF